METLVHAIKFWVLGLFDTLNRTVVKTKDQVETMLTTKADKSEVNKKADQKFVERTISNVYEEIDYVYDEIDSFMKKDDPRGTGSFAMNAKDGEPIGDWAFIEGCGNVASGITAHAEGNATSAIGDNSHAEGYKSIASGRNSHAEGDGTRASGSWSHAEGATTLASGLASHAEGYRTIALGDHTHVEGTLNLTGFEDIFAEEFNENKDYSRHDVVLLDGQVYVCTAYSHRGPFDESHWATPDTPQAFWNYPYLHIVGNGSRIGTADGDFERPSNAHTLDRKGNAWFAGDVYVRSTSGRYQDEGSKKLATEEFVLSSAPQSDWDQLDSRKADFIKNKPFGVTGLLYRTWTTTKFAVYDDDDNPIGLALTSNIDTDVSILPHITFSDGDLYTSGSVADQGVMYGGRFYPLIAVGDGSVSTPGGNDYVIDIASQTTGTYVNHTNVAVTRDENNTNPIEDYVYVVNYSTIDPQWIPDVYMSKDNPVGTGSFSMNRKDGTQVGTKSVAVGDKVTASGPNAFAEGESTTASGSDSHAEGFRTTAKGVASHAEGYDAFAQGYGSHAEGRGTNATSAYSHIQGKFNALDLSIANTSELGEYAHILGNGTSTNDRSNAHTIKWDGTAWFAGDVYVGSTDGTNMDEGSKKLATEDYVDAAVAAGGGTGGGGNPDGHCCMSDEVALELLHSSGLMSLIELDTDNLLTDSDGRIIAL